MMIVKCGYPPRALTLIPELPASSLGIGRGDQLMVNESKGPSSTTSAPAPAPSRPQPPRQNHKPVQSQAKATALSASGPDFVPVPGGVLVHRVCVPA